MIPVQLSDQVQKFLFLGALAVQCVLLLISADMPFFWDSIQFGSRHAQFFFSHGIHWLPTKLDSGNPPLLGLLVSGSWEVFGRSVQAAHAVIWPFAVVNIALLALLGKDLAPARWGWFPLLWIANPVYAAQTTLVSPDVILVTGILLLWLASIHASKWGIAIGSILIAGVSLRGIVIVSGIGIWWLLDQQHRKFLLWLILGMVPACIYHFFHWVELGWALLPSNSPWSKGFVMQTIQQIPTHGAILAWRLVDHGNVILWCVVVWLWWTGAKLHRTNSVLWLIVFSMSLFPFFLLFSTLNMHRYLLPVYLAGTILLIECSTSTAMKTSVLIILISGNFWIYPDRIAQGWDATLAWLAYPHHRENVLNKMTELGISWDVTASAFPNLGPRDEVDLNGELQAMADFSEQQDASYVFYSNVMNDFSDDQLRAFEQWPVVCQSGSWPVRVILYKNPDHAEGSH